MAKRIAISSNEVSLCDGRVVWEYRVGFRSEGIAAWGDVYMCAKQALQTLFGTRPGGRGWTSV